MKAINFINWKYIGLTGCLVASLLTACGDDETGPEVVTPLEPKLEIVNEASTFSFSSAGNSAQVLTFNANQDWHIVLDDSEGVDNSWVVLAASSACARVLLSIVLRLYPLPMILS